MIDERLGGIWDCLYRVAARALIVRDGKVLLVQEKGEKYSFPGGGVDHGDGFSQTIIRKLSEEIDIEISHGQITKQPIFACIGKVVSGIPRIHLYFRVDLGNAEPVVKELPFAWVTFNELETLNLVGNIDAGGFLQNIIKEIAT